MNKKSWIHVINPKGMLMEVDEERWPELSRKGYTKLESPAGEATRIDDREYLDALEV